MQSAVLLWAGPQPVAHVCTLVLDLSQIRVDFKNQGYLFRVRECDCNGGILTGIGHWI